MEGKKPELDEALSSTYSVRDPEMGNIRPRHDGASSSRGHESESPEHDIERISDAFYTWKRGDLATKMAVEGLPSSPNHFGPL
ncbi:hypothetical protein R1sor_025239 [Riccia sorocarpa]|uniref:Uncharacterized protein n=1 Tax=Riccia sorocarpa TaxID=122646 RepID=A0ABD3G9E9_9MARC